MGDKKPGKAAKKPKKNSGQMTVAEAGSRGGEASGQKKESDERRKK